MKKFLLMLKGTFLSIGFLEYCALGLVNTFNVAVFFIPRGLYYAGKRGGYRGLYMR